MALASAGLTHLSAGTVVERMNVKLPDETARIIDIGYGADSRGEAARVVNAVIESYNQFLRDHYQKNNNQAISLIIKARDELSKELKDLERQYLEFRQKNPAYSTEEKGRTFIARRLDQWDQMANQMLARVLQVRAQLDLGQKLADEGAGTATITNALNQLDGLGGGEYITPIIPEVAGGPGISYQEARGRAERGRVPASDGRAAPREPAGRAGRRLIVSPAGRRSETRPGIPRRAGGGQPPGDDPEDPSESRHGHSSGQAGQRPVGGRGPEEVVETRGGTLPAVAAAEAGTPGRSER